MRGKAVFALGALILGLASCSSGSTEKTTGGLTRVSVGYVPYSDDAALFLTKERGVFAKHGLDVTLTPAATPVDVVSSMVSGHVQFGFVTTPALITVNVQGTPLKCVSTVDGRVPTDPAKDGTMLVAAKGSGIRSVGDLAGKKVATVQLAALNSLSVKMLAQRAGVSPTGFQFIQMPFPQMPTALSQGRVEAAVIVSPFVNTALAQGATVINHPNVTMYGGGTIACLSSLGSYIDQHTDTVTAFHAAVNEGVAYAQAHQSEAKATLSKYLRLTPEVAQQQILSTDWNPVLNVPSVGRIQDDMKQIGFIQKTVPVSSLIWPPAAA